MRTELAFMAIAPAFTLICVGVLVRRSSFVSEQFWPSAEKLTHYIFFPAFLIHSISLAGDLEASSKTTIFVLTGVTLLILAAVIAGCRLFSVPHAVFTSITQGSIRFNSFIFLSVSAELLTPSQYGVAAVVVAYMVAISNTLVLLSFEKMGERRGNPLRVVSKVALNPLILASAIGIVLNLLHAKLGPGIAQSLEVLGAPALPISLICVGAALRASGDRTRLYAAGVLTTAIRLIGFPAFSLIALKIFPVSQLSANLILLYSVLPCASNSYVLSTQYGGDHKLMAFVVALSTTLSFAPIFLVASSM